MNKKEYEKVIRRVPADLLAEAVHGLEQLLSSLPTREAVRLLNEDGAGTYDLSISNQVRLGEVRMVHRVAERIVNRVREPLTLGELLDRLRSQRDIQQRFKGVVPQMPNPLQVPQSSSPPFVEIPYPMTFDELDRRLAAKAGKQ